MTTGPSRQHGERMAAQELLKTYGTPGATEGVMGQPHYSQRSGLHHDVWTAAKDPRGMLGPVQKIHIPYGG